MNQKNQNIEGSLSVGRDMEAGGNVRVQGRMKVGHGLKVEGWLDAPNIKGVCKGWFVSADKLGEAYQRPQPGWYAYVGEDLNTAVVYKVSEGGWVATDLVYQGEQVELGPVLDEIDSVSDSVSDVRDTIDSISSELSGKLDADKLVTLSESEYDALRAKEASTYYFIYED